MRPFALALALTVSLNALAGAAVDQPEPTALARAREAYNEGRYDAAIGSARRALELSEQPGEARLVLARALLERFRTTSEPQDLVEARDLLRRVELSRLPPAERHELMIGFGQWLFLTGRYGAAAELFDIALGSAGSASAQTRDRVLDWWASALDRQVQESGGDASELYSRVLDRMEDESRRDPACASAGYWVAAAARALGQLDRAWQAAMAAWVRTDFTADRAAALRADLDRLVLTAIIPDRAREAAGGRGDQRQVADTMVTEWERFKADWEPSPPAPSSQPR
jgi:hypothetical protein